MPARPPAVQIVPPGRLAVGLQLPVAAQSTIFAQPWEREAGVVELTRVAKTCDRTGFFYVAVCDHVCVPRAQAAAMSTIWYDAVATMGFLAAATKHVRLLSYVYVPAYRHPLQTAKAFLLDLRPPPQQSFTVFQGRRGHGDAQVARVQDRLERGFAKAITLEGLAAEAGMSPRNLHRRFKAMTGEAPRAYLQRVRIEAAKRLLERTRNGIEQIGYEVGYGDSRFFRRLFRKQVGTDPTSYRKRFSPKASRARMTTRLA